MNGKNNRNASIFHRNSYRIAPFLFLCMAVAACLGPAQPQAPAQATIAPVQTLAASPLATASGSPTPLAIPAATSLVGSIQPAGNMRQARAAFTATLLQDGRVLIAGGFGRGEDSYTDSAELYGPSSGTFTPTGKMAIRRCCQTATLLPDGRVLIAGGFNGQYLSQAEIYDPETGQFTPASSMTTDRMDHTAVLLEDGKVLLAGGVGTGWTFLSSAELYDPATGRFTPTGGMAEARESHTLTRLLDGRVLVTGGHRGRHAAIVIYASAEIYDPAQGVFEPAGRMILRRHKHDAVLLADGRVLITGGSDESDDQGAYTSAEIYDPGSGQFIPIGDMPGIRYKHIGTSLLLKNGDILLAGGAQYAALYEPQEGRFFQVPGALGTSALSRLFAAATLLQDGRALIAGGYGLGQNVSSQAWVYTP